MNIYEVNKILSSSSKSQIIAHFWDCQCHNHGVTHMCNKLNMKQANMSKHISSLSKLGILSFKQIGKERFYYINQTWKEEWSNIITPQLQAEENKKSICSCSHK